MTANLNDQELANRMISNGDESAFRALYSRHTPIAYKFLLRLTGGSVVDAEDLMQETWFAAARGLAKFRWTSAFQTWLLGIALNQFREFARKKGLQLAGGGDNCDAQAEMNEPSCRIDLERAMELLPPGYRTILVLHDVERYTHQEIGEQLGISDGTCKSQLHEARKAMRRLLNAGMQTS
jgi:RNA polymerase sigma-70 factor (ECF subfamily)